MRSTQQTENSQLGKRHKATEESGHSDQQAFLPLTQVLAFCILNILRPEAHRFKAEEYQRFFQVADLGQEVTAFLAPYHPDLDSSQLEGDIYFQHTQHSRSLVEEVSNSIDASPERIECTIRDGYYEVREVNGQGMTPEQICTQYLPPKASSKVHAERQIGRFGIGSYIKLAHLNGADASVVVETRARGHTGCRIEYRLIAGKIYISLKEDPNISHYGTVTKVTSSEIHAEDYQKTLTASLGANLPIPIFINGCLWVPEDPTPHATIAISGIVIQKISLATDQYVTRVSWNLPPGTTISENRSAVIVDRVETVRAIQAEIDKLYAMPDPEWARYANTIAPLVAELQLNNTSLLLQDDVLHYLRQAVYKKLAQNACIPDQPLYHSLQHPSVIPLHPLLLPPTWHTRIAEPAREWSREGTEIWVVDMQETAQPFIHDEEHNRVFISTTFYQKLLVSNDIDVLALVFSHTEGVTLQRKSAESNEDAPLASPQVTYNEVLTRHPYHDLYQQHGLLWLYGEEATRKIVHAHADAEPILRQAKTLLALYPALPVPDNLQSELTPLERVAPLCALTFQGQRFYYGADFYKWLLDANFQPLWSTRYQLLKAKIEQVLAQRYKDWDDRREAAYTADLDITLSADDLLVSYDEEKQVYYLCDGLGNRVDPSFTSENRLECQALGKGYFIVGHVGSRTRILYHRTQGRIAALPTDFYGRIETIAEQDIIMGTKNNNPQNIVFLYSLTQRQFLFSEYSTILHHNSYLLGVKNNSFVLCRLNGEKLYESTHISWKPTTLRQVHCQEVTPQQFHLSLLDDSGGVHFLQIDSATHSHRYVDPAHTLGFPVTALLRDAEQGSRNTLHILYSPRTITHASPSKELHIPSYIPVEYSSHLGLFDSTLPDLILIPDLSISIQDIKTIIKDQEGYYYLTLSNQDIILVSPEGRCLAKGKKITLLKTTAGNYIHQDDRILNPDGQPLIQKENFAIAYSEPIHTSDGEYLAVTFKSSDQDYKTGLYDLSGREMLAPSRSCYIYTDKVHGAFPFTKIGDVLHSVYGTVPRGIISYDNGHAPKESNDLVRVFTDSKYGFLLTQAGYPFFNREIPDYPRVLRQHVFVSRSSSKLSEHVFYPLTVDDLTNTQVLQNLAYLNQCHLDAYCYGQALRFVHWPFSAFKQIQPYLHLFSYTAFPQHAEDYQAMISFAEKLSPEACEQVLRFFNLVYAVSHEQLVEPIAQKIINIIEVQGLKALIHCYTELDKYKHRIACFPSMQETQRVINEMPVSSAQLCYYLFYPEQQLLAVRKTPALSLPDTAQETSIIALMAAHQFNTQALDRLGSAEFSAEINRWGGYVDRAYLIRTLQHAIYHQADPNKHLYERELLQNAMDAYAALSITGQEARIAIHLFREGDHCVFRIRDHGCGMSLDEVFQHFLLVGASSKRADRHAHFIGGHGVGAFTIYHDAELLRLRTGKNDGVIHCFELRPVYNEQNQVIDVHIKWQTIPGLFQGTEVERVARSRAAVLDAARHRRTLKMHAGTINADIVRVFLNGDEVEEQSLSSAPAPVTSTPATSTPATSTPAASTPAASHSTQLNHSMVPIASISIPVLGYLVLYRSSEDMLTVGGLAVRKINELDQFIPEAIRKVVRKQGLVIDLPKQLSLNRERTELIDAEHVYAFLKPFLLQGYIQAYLRLFMNNHLALSELPYDFFERFQQYKGNMEQTNPELLHDAECISHNLPLSNYEKYQDLARLHELMAYLPLFHAKNHERSYTLIELAHYYQQHRQLPELEFVPAYLHSLAREYNDTLASQKWQRQVALTLDNFPQRDWLPDNLANQPAWQALIKISEYLANCLGYPAMQFGFSTSQAGDALHTRAETHTIYWNIYSASHGLAQQLMEALQRNVDFTRLLYQLLDFISHEITHAALETGHSTTHNRTFWLKQRTLLTQLFMHHTRAELMTGIKAIYQQYVGGRSNELDCRALLRTQFALSESATITPSPAFSQRHSMFAPLPLASPSADASSSVSQAHVRERGVTRD
ncbi:MAG: hypothetical protein A3E83_05440 [Gammaproteobacteria bacterium RIFCSPHIGHO2_12_FULL_41_20]|nr:MAG: hypothetical protein A3E83_05440 [Gammaproteobacteria bacterium RIFCSPHIGHO2_12_FULL_41_20]